MIFKNEKIIFLFCVILCFVFFYGCKNHKCRSKVSDATIGYSYSSFGFIVISTEDGKFFIIDTGSELSYIFSNRMETRPTIGRTYLINIKEKRILRSQKVNLLKIGKFQIENHDFIFKKSKSTLYKDDTTIAGLIGMDILSQKYCYFDIKNQTLTLSEEKKVQTETPYLVFSYKSSTRPLVSLCINGTTFEDVLFDTGFSGFLNLLEEDREKLNIPMVQLENNIQYDFFNNQSAIQIEQLDSIRINDVDFVNLEISYSQKHRLLGMEFVKCWSSFVIDPFKMEIAFYL